MSKVNMKPGNMLYPLPAVMVSCRSGEVDNIITIAWAGTICTNPPMLSISIRKERYSHEMIKSTGEFVVNIPNKDLAFQLDYCGVRSGRDVDKFEHLKLTKEAAKVINVPLIKEAPVNIECKVKQILELGSHDMFIAEVVSVNVDDKLFDKEGRLHLYKQGLINYTHGQYCAATESIGKFGFSVEKKKTKSKKRNPKHNVKK